MSQSLFGVSDVPALPRDELQEEEDAAGKLGTLIRWEKHSPKPVSCLQPPTNQTLYLWCC